MKRNLLFFAMLLCLAPCGFATDDQCVAVQNGTQWEIKSPFFVYRLSTDNGLQAKSWTNLISGSTVTLSGPEIEIDLGDDPEKPTVTALTVIDSKQTAGSLAFTLEDVTKTLSVLVKYKWDNKTPFLHKFTTITNRSDSPIRVLNVRLGTYTSNAQLHDKIQVTPTGVFAGELSRTGDKEQGFPLYLNDDFVLSLAHPAGWSTNLNGVASLRQYPGAKLSAKESFECMEAVYGVGAKGEARKNFVDHVRNRCRRVVRNHDRPYTIFHAMGSWPEGRDGHGSNVDTGNWTNKEEYVLRHLRQIAESQESVGQIFDFFAAVFGILDPTGDLKKWNQYFPNGYERIRPIIENLGMKGSFGFELDEKKWNIGLNPVTIPSQSAHPESFCQASEPIRSMFREAAIYYVREKKMHLMILDNFNVQVCNIPEHGHLPGIHSTEELVNTMIQLLHAMDKECPDVFLMLEWGFRSPWWLLHADVLVDTGGGEMTETSTPSQYPAAYVRASTTQKLDQLQLWCDDIPWLGKDTYGTWLSDWTWNSRIGKERWQESLLMDICRGSMLLQIWTDWDFLSPPEWRQLADFAALLKAQSKCFANPRTILGNPNNPEPYGYCCTDGQRAFLAINNCTWKDQRIALELNSKWGLPDGQQWEIYRWYPDPVKFVADSDGFRSGASLLCKPFETVLLEVVPVGTKPSLDRTLPEEKIPREFAEKSRELDITVIDSAREFIVKTESPVTEGGGILAITVEVMHASQPALFHHVEKFPVPDVTINGVVFNAVTPIIKEAHFSTCWQGWRLEIAPNSPPQKIEFRVSPDFPQDTDFIFKSHFIPHKK